nr:MAG TPA: hypothetical protein [Caudoviricetes sp.]DAR77245.1 MAG TPA: hypothetical protein [Caudoviricetes sp.]
MTLNKIIRRDRLVRYCTHAATRWRGRRAG